MSKYYAVKKGRKIGVFSNWEECKVQVSGYPNAVYKSFNTYLAAKEFLNEGISSKNISSNDKKVSRIPDVIAYIDGSYDHSKKMYSYAGILITKDNVKTNFAYTDSNSSHISLRNVAGELRAAMHSIKLSLENGAKSIEIYYDYAGIEEWANGNWKAKNFFTQDYVKFIDEMRLNIEITFNKVKAHSGVKYNEEVDLLAKEAIKNNEPRHQVQLLQEVSIKGEKNQIDIFNDLKSTKKRVSLNLLVEDEVYDNDRLYDIFKSLCKEKGLKMKDIEGFITVFDFDNKQILFKVEALGTVEVMRYEI
ncbi:viroplasmin family protein [Alkalihalobacillus sp. FSL W8-0930]